MKSSKLQQNLTYKKLCELYNKTPESCFYILHSKQMSRGWLIVPCVLAINGRSAMLDSRREWDLYANV